MLSSKPMFYNHTSLVKQILAAIIRNRPFDPLPKSPSAFSSNPWTNESVSEVLRSIPRFFFNSPRSIGRQNGFRHRTPMRQRNLRQESEDFDNNVLVLGPAAHRDPHKVTLGLDKAIDFFYWVETSFGFRHNEMTCREMACVLARGNRSNDLWTFLREMSGRGSGGLVTTATVTCAIKVLGEEGLVNEALATFYRMKHFHCEQDVYMYNTVINALCRVGNFNKAKFLLKQMELPGFRCPPDTYTYTILISSYCRYGLQTACKKATRRRIGEANSLFRIMLFRGFIPDTVTYNCLIDGCCKTNRIERALELFSDMNTRGCMPNQVTYNSFIRYFSAVNEVDKAVEMMRMMQTKNHGTPNCSSYTPILHALCEVGRVQEARNFLVELVDRRGIPREYTYKLVCDALDAVGEASLLNDEMRRKIEDDIKNRCRQIMKVKPVLKSKMSL